MKTYRNPDGVEVSVFTCLEAADPGYFEEIERNLADHEVVLYRRAQGYEGPGKTKTSKAPSEIEMLFDWPHRIEDYVLRDVFGLKWRGARVDFTGTHFVRTDVSRPEGENVGQPSGPTDLEFLKEDVKNTSDYFHLRTRSGGDALGDLFQDLKTLLTDGGSRAAKLFAARELAMFLNAFSCRQATPPEREHPYTRRRNDPALKRLGREVRAGKKEDRSLLRRSPAPRPRGATGGGARLQTHRDGLADGVEDRLRVVLPQSPVGVSIVNRTDRRICAQHSSSPLRLSRTDA